MGMDEPRDRRNSFRYPCEVRAACRAGASRFFALSRNISTTGICLVTSQEVQDQLEIELPAELSLEERTVNVTYSRTTATSRIVGGWFTEPLADENRIENLALAAKPVLLVVEEEDGVRELLKLALAPHGVNIWAVASGLDALAICRRHHKSIPLAMIDVGMRGMDGPKTLATLKGIAPDVTCWFMTGGTAKYTNEELLKAGALRVINKPFDLAWLVGELKAATSLPRE